MQLQCMRGISCNYIPIPYEQRIPTTYRWVFVNSMLERLKGSQIPLLWSRGYTLQLLMLQYKQTQKR